MFTEMVGRNPDSIIGPFVTGPCLANNDRPLCVVALYAGGADRDQFLYNDHS